MLNYAKIMINASFLLQLSLVKGHINNNNEKQYTGEKVQGSVPAKFNDVGKFPPLHYDKGINNIIQNIHTINKMLIYFDILFVLAEEHVPDARLHPPLLPPLPPLLQHQANVHSTNSAISPTFNLLQFPALKKLLDTQ